MRILFFKDTLAWPRFSGHDVHTYSLMKALANLDHTIGLATIAPPSELALAGLPLAFCRLLSDDQGAESTATELHLTRLQERYRRYWGVERSALYALRESVKQFRPDAVVAAGLDALPYLASIDGVTRVWYAADEWVLHHVSQVLVSRPGSWENLRAAAIKGLYERAFAPVTDLVWVVSRAEQWATRWLAGMRRAVVLPNGVDIEYFTPIEAPPIPQSAVFWGRLDFGPNIQALEWFCTDVWPAVRRQAPDARFTIIGSQPTRVVQNIAGHDGIVLLPDLPDLRPEVARHRVVVLPFVSGGGIKNKLLEAASLGKPILCTPRACSGLRDPSAMPAIRATNRRSWTRELTALWADEPRASRLGVEARAWVAARHSWAATAREAVASLEQVTGRHHPLPQAPTTASGVESVN